MECLEENSYTSFVTPSELNMPQRYNSAENFRADCVTAAGALLPRQLMMIVAGYDALLTPREAGVMLSKSPLTIFRWMQEGVLQSTPGPDGVLRVHAVDIYALCSKLKLSVLPEKTAPGSAEYVFDRLLQAMHCIDSLSVSALLDQPTGRELHDIESLRLLAPSIDAAAFICHKSPPERIRKFAEDYFYPCESCAALGKAIINWMVQQCQGASNDIAIHMFCKSMLGRNGHSPLSRRFVNEMIDRINEEFRATASQPPTS